MRGSLGESHALATRAQCSEAIVESPRETGVVPDSRHLPAKLSFGHFLVSAQNRAPPRSQWRYACRFSRLCYWIQCAFDIHYFAGLRMDIHYFAGLRMIERALQSEEVLKSAADSLDHFACPLHATNCDIFAGMPGALSHGCTRFARMKRDQICRTFGGALPNIAGAFRGACSHVSRTTSDLSCGAGFGLLILCHSR